MLLRNDSASVGKNNKYPQSAISALLEASQRQHQTEAELATKLGLVLRHL